MADTKTTEHSSDCKRWFLAFSYAKTMLQRYQRECPCCVNRRKTSVKTQVNEVDYIGPKPP